MAAEDPKFVPTPGLSHEPSTAINPALGDETPESSIGIGSEAVITVPDEGEGSNEVGIGNTELVSRRIRLWKTRYQNPLLCKRALIIRRRAP